MFACWVILKYKLHFLILMCFKWHQLYTSVIHITELFLFQKVMYCHCPIHFECCMHKGFVPRHHCKSMLLDYIFKQNVYRDSHPTVYTRAQYLHEGQVKSTLTYRLVYWKSKWNQQFLEYFNKRFNVCFNSEFLKS